MLPVLAVSVSAAVASWVGTFRVDIGWVCADRAFLCPPCVPCDACRVCEGDMASRDDNEAVKF